MEYALQVMCLLRISDDGWGIGVYAACAFALCVEIAAIIANTNVLGNLFFMKAKEYFEQIKPHIGVDSFPEQLMEMTKSIILEGNEIATKRQIKKVDSLKSVFSECNLKFRSICKMIEKETDSYTLDDNLFFFIFKAIMPDVYLMLYSN